MIYENCYIFPGNCPCQEDNIQIRTKKKHRKREREILSSIEFYFKNSTVGFESFVKFIHLFLIERSIHFCFHSINKNNNDNYILFHYYILQFSLFHIFFIELDVLIPEWAKPQTYTIFRWKNNKILRILSPSRFISNNSYRFITFRYLQ